MHLTCTNMPKESIDDALAKCKEAGTFSCCDPPLIRIYAHDICARRLPH